MTENWKPLVSDEELNRLLREYCNDFTALEREGRYDPITGRDEEIDNTILILLQKGRKNAVLLAPAGVGKTALAVGLAQRIVAGTVPDYLKNARVLEVDLARMASGTSSPAEFQARFIPLCKGVAERYHRRDLPRIILFIDEIHQIMPGCAGSSYKGLSDVMKPYLTVGDLLVIGATTLDEFRLYVTPDAALERRFQKIFLEQPNIVETYRILQGVRPSYERHHGVTIANDKLLLIAKLTHEHMRRRTQPDKSIISMDAALAHHVKEKGAGGEIDLESIYYMIGRETGLNRNALHDEKKVRLNLQETEELEARIKAGTLDTRKDERMITQGYDPSKAIKTAMGENEKRELEETEKAHESMMKKRALQKEEDARKNQGGDRR
ncbi:MAG: AAA family ATPase [Alphaproteobacteria bacterium]|nr:AAA family ATPase [Alphaproteobacteria bacterium]